MNKEPITELGYVLMDLDNIKAYMDLIMREYPKIVDRLCCIRMALNKEKNYVQRDI
jgi:hypothetical protein